MFITCPFAIFVVTTCVLAAPAVNSNVFDSASAIDAVLLITYSVTTLFNAEPVITSPGFAVPPPAGILIPPFTTSKFGTYTVSFLVAVMFLPPIIADAVIAVDIVLLCPPIIPENSAPLLDIVFKLPPNI